MHNCLYCQSNALVIKMTKIQHFFIDLFMVISFSQIVKERFQLLYIFMTEILQHFLNFIHSIQKHQVQPITNVAAAIDAMDKILNTIPTLSPKKFDAMWRLFEELMANRKYFSMLTLAIMYDCLINQIQKSPKLVTQKINICTSIIRNTVNILAEISTQTSELWLHPNEGAIELNLQEVDEDLKASRMIKIAFQMFATSIGHKQTRSLFQPIFRQNIDGINDWRFKYGALIAATQLGQDYQEIQEFNIYIEWAIKSLQHPQPKIRYAALQLIGQYSDDLKPLFQQNYFEAVVPSVLKILYDPVPEVVSHCFGCLDNFFDDYKECEKINGCINQLLQPLSHYIQFGTSCSLKQNALAVLSSLASIQYLLESSIAQILEISKFVLTNYLGQQKYSEIVNYSFEVISVLLSSQNKLYTQQYVPQYIQLLIVNREKMDICYFINCWSHFSQAFTYFADINSIFPFLFAEIQNQVNDSSQQLGTQALECLIHTSSSFKQVFQPYIDSVISFARNLLKDFDATSLIREKSMRLTLHLSKILKKDTSQTYHLWYSLTTANLAYFLETIDHIFEQQQCGSSSFLQNLFDGIHESVKQLQGCFKETQIMNLAQKLSSYQNSIEKMQKSFSNNEQTQHQQVVQCDNVDGDSDSQFQEIDILSEDDEDYLGGALQIIPQIYTTLLKIAPHQQKTILITFILPNISSSISKQQEWKLFGVNLALAIVQVCSYNQLAAYWGDIMSLFIQFSNHGFSRLRNVAVQGMGIIFTKTPIELTAQSNILNWLDILSKSIIVPFENAEQDIAYMIQHAKDNAVAALGKLLQTYGSIYPHQLNQEVFRKWMSFLPLNYDLNEGNGQQIYLADLIKKNPSILVKDANDLIAICQIYAKFVMKRSKVQPHQEALAITKESIREISQWSLFCQSSDYLWNSLTHSQRTALTKLMKN